MTCCARRVVAASAMALATGCYSFHEVAPGSVTPGATVRVTLSTEEAVRQQQGLGGLRQQVEGEVVPLETTGTLGLTIPLREGSPADRPGLNTFLDVPWTSVMRIEEKRLSVGRTVALAGAGAAATIAILAVSTGGTGGGEDPPSNSVLVPVLRLLFR